MCESYIQTYLMVFEHVISHSLYMTISHMLSLDREHGDLCEYRKSP